MDHPILSIIAIFFFALFPLILWGYGHTFLYEHGWNRVRFFGGLAGGGLSVAAIMLFDRFFVSGSLALLSGLVGVFGLVGLIMLVLIRYGSPYVRGLLYQILALHSMILLMLIGLGYLGQSVTLSLPVISLGGVVGFVVSAYLEEGVKHISSIGLSSRDFRFSRRDLLLFTFFITLGFITLENILYLIRAYEDGLWSVIFTGLYRLIFALPLHVFAASICVMLWWRALSYRLFSWRYILSFLGGFVIATLVHTLYNHLIDRGALIPLIVLTGIGYIAFTQWIIDEERD